MPNSILMSPDELALVDALQVAPRASWTAIGQVLGISAVTAARRWAELAESGAAWVTAAPGMAAHNAQCLAYVEITCRPKFRLAVAHEIAMHPLAVTVELTTGSADLLVTVAAIDLPTLSHYLMHLDQVRHVQSVRARIATRLYSEGSAWRLHLLDRAQVLQLRDIRRRPLSDDDREPPEEMTPPVRTMLTRLAVDGRTPFADLAEEAGISVSTARRHVARLLNAGVIILRTDVNSSSVRWPVQVYHWADAPPEKLVEIARALSQFRNTRLTATVSADQNVALCSWLHSIEEVHRFEFMLATKLPQLRIVNRLVVLRQIKRMGRLLNERGFATGVVPINLWDDPWPHHEVH